MRRVEISVIAMQGDRLAIARALDAAPGEWSIDFVADEAPPSGICIAATDTPAAPADSIRFDPRRPEELVPAIAERLGAASATTVIVTGASRGAGVTTIALHLAAALARSARTCFVDLDTAWGSRHRLGLPDDVLSWASPDPKAALLPAAGGFRAIVSPGDASPPPLDLLQKLTAGFDRVVVDSPEGLPSFGSIRAVILVVPPSDEGARRARRVLDRSPHLPWVCVANRLGPGGEVMRKEIERIMGRRLGVELPCTPALRDVEGERLLRSRLHRWVQRIDALSEAIL